MDEELLEVLNFLKNTDKPVENTIFSFLESLGIDLEEENKNIQDLENSEYIDLLKD